MRSVCVVALLLLLQPVLAFGRQPPVDEAPARPGEWGFRPAEGASVSRTPPSFSWRPQPGATSYELQASRDAHLGRIEYEARGLPFNVHCPPRVLGYMSPYPTVESVTMP